MNASVTAAAPAPGSSSPAPHCPALELRDVRKEYPGGVRAVDGLTLSIEHGEFFSLMGPSGCGKTTTLRLIAGLDSVTAGTIAISGTEVSSRTHAVPPEGRQIGVVFQDYALFPHMTVAENIGFGIHSMSRQPRGLRVADLLDLVGLVGLSGSYPHELSGGQRQRVALARSLAPSPRVILLDEPFSNLDAELRSSLREETRAILKASGTTTILVTHDREEAFSLSDRVGLLNNGRLDQVGVAYDVYHYPVNRYVAELTGKADFLPAEITNGRIHTSLGEFPANERPVGSVTRGELMIRPDDVTIVPDVNGAGVICGAEFLGGSILYALELANGERLHALMPSVLPIPAGTRVTLRFDPAHLVFMPHENGS